MFLKDEIAKSILEYPSLFLCETYQDSKILVLERLFLMGSGSWANTLNPLEGGYMIEPSYIHGEDGMWDRDLDLPYGEHKVVLPFNDIEAEWEDVIGYCVTQRIEKQIESSARFSVEWGTINNFKDDVFREIHKKIYEQNFEFIDISAREPYPFSIESWAYSGIEPELIQPDWREGIIEICERSLNWFHTGKYKESKHFVIEGDEYKDITSSTNNWESILEEYSIRDYCKEGDWDELARIRNSHVVSQHIKALIDAIVTLKSLRK